MSDIADPTPRWWRRAACHWLLVAAAAALVFLASTDRFSDVHTARMLAKFVGWAGAHGWHADIDSLNAVFRKTAHVLEYAALAALLFRAIAVSRRHGTKLGWKVAALSLVLAAAYAATDEWHQRFVPSRGASVRDVFLDTGGALAGLCVIGVWGIVRCRSAAQEPVG